MTEINLSNLTPDVRYLDDMRKVLFDRSFAESSPNCELYYMYRGIEEKNGLRYDILTMPAKMLGKEFLKTKGHYHVGKYGEVYIVLEGKAIFLLQKAKNDQEIEDVVAVKAEKGDVVVVPSYYGHVTTNCSESQEMKMANWVSLDCKSDYLPYEEKQGACYYYIKDPVSGEAKWIKNPNYKSVPELRFEEPLKSIPEDLSFLK
jgi:glucose-6-phosphate isomerase